MKNKNQSNPKEKITTQNSQNQKSLIWLGVVLLAIAGFIWGYNAYQNSGSTTTPIVAGTTSSNVKMVNGKQEISIIAGNGYNPRVSIAKAGVATTIKIQGKNAYGCESAVTIPSLKYAKNLDANGSDSVEVEPQKAGTTMEGLCGMGMYRFQIKFE